MNKGFKLLKEAEKDIKSFAKSKIQPLSFFEKVFYLEKPYQSIKVGIIIGCEGEDILKVLISRDTIYFHFFYTESYDLTRTRNFTSNSLGEKILTTEYESYETWINKYEYFENEKRLYRCSKMLKEGCFFDGKLLNE